MSDKDRLRWAEVEPLEIVNGELKQVLASVDALREAWEVSLAQACAGELAEARRRSLRRHAIETGLIERLYDVSWGVTEALVADALAIIRSQYDALEFLAEAARNGTDLSVHFVRELRQALCRTQPTYEARDYFGQLPLHHGTWKMQPNYVQRHDGTLRECTPPEHIQSQMERLLELYKETVEPAAEGTGALAVAQAYAHRLRALQQAQLTERATKAEALASELQKKVVAHLDQLGADIRDQFREADPTAYSSVVHAAPPDETARYWQIQIVRTGRDVNMFTNLSKGSWWTRLHPSEDDERPLPTPLFKSTPADSVTLVFSDDPDTRWHEVCELMDNTLAAALASFAQELG